MNTIERIQQILFAIFAKEVEQEKIKHIIISFTRKEEGDVMTEEEKQESFLKELKTLVLEKIQTKARQDYMNETLRGVEQAGKDAIIGLE